MAVMLRILPNTKKRVSIAALGNMEASVVAKSVAFCLLAIALMVSSNSLFALAKTASALWRGLALAMVLLIEAFYFAARPLEARVLRRLCLWSVAVSLVYLVMVVRSGGSLGGIGTAIYFALAAVLPWMLVHCSQAGDLDELLGVFSATVAVYALATVVVWALGPMLGVLPHTTSLEHTWNGSGSISIANGYLGIVYETQAKAIDATVLWRNTGFYPEGPMYSYVLCVALGFEVFLRRDGRRRWVLLSIAVAILTTLTTTCLVYLAVCFVYLCGERLLKSGLSRRAKALILLVACLLAIGIVALLLGNKLDSSSGSTRMDDFHSGFLAWIANPIFGGGLDASDSYKAFIDASRASNQGFSNSLFDVLMRGGLVLLSLWILQFVGLVKNPANASKRLWAASYLFLWLITIVTFLPLTALVLSLGVAGLALGGVPVTHTKRGNATGIVSRGDLI